MLPRVSSRRRDLVYILLPTLFVVLMAAGIETPIALEFEIHPNFGAEQCARLPHADEVSEEDDFPELISRGWVTLMGYTFDVDRGIRRYCKQIVSVEFPTEQLYQEFVRTMSACPQYPFFSAADHNLQTQIFERTAALGDTAAYRTLIAKDDSFCASELNAPLFSILRKNPTVFLQAFSELAPQQQEIAAATQYDFNHELSEQQFSPEVISSLPERLRASATRFNELLAGKGR